MDNIQEQPAPEAVTAAAVDRAGWTCTASSENAGSPCGNVLDGDANTIWHTQYEPDITPFPHTITIDFKQNLLIGSIMIQPRPGGGNGAIGQHVISLR